MMRAMEDFLINPTIVDTDDIIHIPTMGHKRQQSTTSSERWVVTKDSYNMIDPAATLRSIIGPADFSRGYGSEEEAPSPIEADDISFDSSTESSVHSEELKDDSFPEQLAVSCNHVEQQCSKAQAVVMTKMPRAKMVSMPKIVEVGASRMKKPASVLSLQQIAAASSQHTSRTSSRRQSAKTSKDTSPTATAPSSIYEQPKPSRQMYRQPSKPLMDTAMQARASADFLRYDPYPSQTSSYASTPSSETAPKLRRKLSSSFNIGRFSLGLRRHNSNDNSIDEEFSSSASEKGSSGPAIPSRKSSRPSSTHKYSRSMGERAPMIDISPSPKEEDEVS